MIMNFRKVTPVAPQPSRISQAVSSSFSFNSIQSIFESFASSLVILESFPRLNPRKYSRVLALAAFRLLNYSVPERELL